MASDSAEPWGQLVCTSDTCSDPVVLEKSKFLIGRSKGADLSLSGNKLISGTHCVILRDNDSAVWIQDTSSNGTLINYKDKVHGEKRELQHGDEFHLVYKKTEDYLNVSYMYQDLARLKAEEESEETFEYSLSDDTSATVTLTDTSSPDRESRKRSRSPSVQQEPPDSLVKEKKRKVGASEISVKGKVKSEETGSCAEVKEEKESEKEVKVKGKEIESGTGSKDKNEKSEEGKKKTEGMEENLICIICQEILHDCISCQPCMHSFCAGCYSDWMKRSSECPACRLEVSRVNKNHIVKNLVEVYLKEHPDRRRPKADTDELDKKNTITADMLKPPKPKRTMSEYIDDEDEDESDENDDDSGLVTTSPFASGVLGGGLGLPGSYMFTGMTTGLGFGGTTILRPPKTVCRQCPDYIPDTSTGAATGAAGDSSAGGPSTSTGTSAGADAKILPTPPDFTCSSDSQIHIMCQCCMKPMPDRRTERARDETIPQQQCTLCYRMYCHMYWGCHRDSCLGCLAKFKDMNFGDKIMSSIVLENTYESEVLKEYLKKHGLTVSDLLEECCVRLEAGDYTCVDQVRGFTSNTVTCYSCGLRNFRDLVYQYRKDIPNDDLSPAARSRPNCYWGRNCRTQRGKMEHASKYNHICDQTKT